MAVNDYSGAAAAHDAEEQRVNKRNKLILYIVLFVIFQTGVIAVFSLTVMKIRTPKFRVISAALTDVAVGTPANSSFSATMNVVLSVKNANFGRYKFDGAVVDFQHGGATAGQATVGASRVSMRSTKKIETVVNLNIAASDVSSGIVALSSSGKMKGKVELFFVMKKKRSTSMSCSMEIEVAKKEIKNIACK